MTLLTRLAVLCIAGATIVATEANAANYQYRRPNVIGSILPENNFQIPVWQESANGLNKEMFDNVLNRVEKIYAPIFATKSLKLVIERKWDDPTVNAYAQRFGDTAHVAMFGGLARHPAVTPDGFALVVCHEIGHHLGGVPKVTDWASNEGQADYFGTLKCMRKVLRGMDTYSKSRSLYNTRRDLVNDYVAGKCTESFKNPADRDICVLSSAAGMSLAMLFADLHKLPAPPQYNTPDPKVVTRTDDSHPMPQCRLDTYFAGALCPISDNEEVSNTDVNAGTCTPKRGFQGAVLRSRCWFAEPSSFMRF